LCPDSPSVNDSQGLQPKLMRLLQIFFDDRLSIAGRHAMQIEDISNRYADRVFFAIVHRLHPC